MRIVRSTDIDREGLQGGSLNRINRELVVGVNGSETSRNLIKNTKRIENGVPRPQNVCHSPNHFFEAFPDSMTSTTPGRRGSIEGTWLARMPMSPVAAAMLTWVTSAEVKIAWFLVQRPLTRKQTGWELTRTW